VSVPEIGVSELPDDAVVLDVREPFEWTAGRAANAVHVPMGRVPDSLGRLPTSAGPLPVICRSGARSAQVAAYLVAHGIDAVNVAGGTQAWAAAGKPMTADSGTPVVA
jgi:rhodanese-related sulfurtransferase